MEACGSRYCAGPAWHEGELLVGLRAGSVEILADRGRRVAELPRAWGEGETVRNPASLMPALVARPRAFGELTVRRDMPRQVEFLLGYLEAEAASRDASKRASLLRRCALPAPKTFDGYDWTALSWPEGLGREDLPSPSFPEAREDLVLMGDVGTGKTRMASALRTMCREARLSAASSLVMRLRRANADGGLDREPSRIGRADLPVVDELGFLPLDAEGARLLFQVVSQAREAQSAVFAANLEFSRWGAVFGDGQMAAAVIDRVAHHGRLLRFRGEPYRVGHALMRGGCSENLRRLGARTAQKPMHVLLRDC